MNTYDILKYCIKMKMKPLETLWFISRIKDITEGDVKFKRVFGVLIEESENSIIIHNSVTTDQENAIKKHYENNLTHSTKTSNN